MNMPIRVHFLEGHSLGNHSRPYSRGTFHDTKKIHCEKWKTSEKNGK